MKYNGQDIATGIPEEKAEGFSYSDTFAVSEERKDEITNAIQSHWKACDNGEHVDMLRFIKELPVDATHPGEVMLTGLFLGQWIARKEDAAESPLTRLFAAIASGH